VLATLLTLEREFEHVELYFVGQQGILLASKQPLRVLPAAIERLQALPSMHEHLRVLEAEGYGGVADLPRWVMFDGADVDALAAQFPDHVVNTDMNRLLEYATPRYQLQKGRTKQVVQSMLQLLPPDKAAQRGHLVPK
jgi:hypothetical protein